MTSTASSSDLKATSHQNHAAAAHICTHLKAHSDLALCMGVSISAGAHQPPRSPGAQRPEGVANRYKSYQDISRWYMSVTGVTIVT